MDGKTVDPSSGGASTSPTAKRQEQMDPKAVSVIDSREIADVLLSCKMFLHATCRCVLRKVCFGSFETPIGGSDSGAWGGQVGEPILLNRAFKNDECMGVLCFGSRVLRAWRVFLSKNA